jgi:hypothetical protein
VEVAELSLLKTGFPRWVAGSTGMGFRNEGEKTSAAADSHVEGNEELVPGGTEVADRPLNHQSESSLTTTRDDGEAASPGLVFPNELNLTERQEAARRLQGLDSRLAQEFSLSSPAG